LGLILEFRDRIVGINTNLEDLQSSVEACTRAANALQTDTAGFIETLRRIKNVPLLGALVKRAAELQARARDQRGALRELRHALRELQSELKRSNGAVRPPPAVAADRSRR
jgi:chromosome segregation ATPase